MYYKSVAALLFSVVVLCVSLTYAKIEDMTVFSSLPVSGKNIIIDPGHGGWDPGKAGSITDEKDINLEIALLLRDYLLSGGAEVSLTRENDTALGKTKSEDMKKRTSHAQNGDADIFISIHQNSFPSESARGAQVFYFNGSEKGEALAECIQQRLVTFADKTNKRKAKENGSYYILKNTTAASVIVECGFLSNPTEEKSLNKDEYQKKLAWAIYMGIWDYFDGENFT